MGVAGAIPAIGSQPETRASVGIGTFRRGLLILSRKRMVWFAVLVLGLGALVALLPLGVLPHDPTQIAIPERFTPPVWVGGTWDHPFGTDNLGRDLASRLAFAARYSLLITVAATAIASIGGLVAGLVAGFFGGWVDIAVTRLIDIQLAFPTVFLALTVLAVAGSSLFNVVLVLAVVDWAALARVIRGSVIATREFDFVEAARASGARDARIIGAHILPNVVAPFVVLTTFAAARILLVESSLSFLGLGVVPPAATWGTMVGDGRNYLANAWWTSTIPGVVIALTVLAISFLGDAMRDAFDPRTR